MGKIEWEGAPGNLGWWKYSGSCTACVKIGKVLTHVTPTKSIHYINIQTGRVIHLRDGPFMVYKIHLL